MRPTTYLLIVLLVCLTAAAGCNGPLWLPANDWGARYRTAPLGSPVYGYPGVGYAPYYRYRPQFGRFLPH